MTCKICGRPKSTSEFCRFHEEAEQHMRKGYEAWIYAYGEIGWQDYLMRLLKLQGTGIWIREVIQDQLGVE